MSKTNDPAARLGELQHLLEVHGADRTRWPAAERLRLAGFIANEPQAQLAVKEAAALDRLLDLAPLVSIERERALASRILRAAAAQPLPSQTADNVVVIASPAKPALTGVRGQLRSVGAALLAASLVLGIFAGTSGQLTSTMDAVAEVIGLSDDEPEVALVSEPATNGEDSL